MKISLDERKKMTALLEDHEAETKVNSDYKEMRIVLDDLVAINRQISELQLLKEAKEQKVLELSGHNKEGASTYCFGPYKVTITTNMNYTVDSEEYLAVKGLLNGINPVVEKVKYEWNKKQGEEFQKYASQEQLALLPQFLTVKPAKPHIKVVI